MNEPNGKVGAQTSGVGDAPAEKFYVMREIEGDECLEAIRDSLEAACTTMVDLGKTVRETELSVCSTTRGILAFLKDGAPVLVGRQR